LRFGEREGSRDRHARQCLEQHHSPSQTVEFIPASNAVGQVSFDASALGWCDLVIQVGRQRVHVDMRPLRFSKW
jgi:hypothetical protein